MSESLTSGGGENVPNIPSYAQSAIFTQGLFWPSGIVIACVCVSVRVSCVCVYQSLACPHDNSSAVQARITKFG